MQSAADLRYRGVGQRRSVAKENGWHGHITVVDLSDDRSTIGMIFDVDLVKVDSGAIQLGLQPYAVATPGGEDGWQISGRRTHSHTMYNEARSAIPCSVLH